MDFKTKFAVCVRFPDGAGQMSAVVATSDSRLEACRSAQMKAVLAMEDINADSGNDATFVVALQSTDKFNQANERIADTDVSNIWFVGSDVDALRDGYLYYVKPYVTVE